MRVVIVYIFVNNVIFRHKLLKYIVRRLELDMILLVIFGNNLGRTTTVDTPLFSAVLCKYTISCKYSSFIS